MALKTTDSSRVALLVVFLVPVLLYLPAVTFGFTWFDDNSLILDNVAFLGDFANAGRVFLTDAFLNGSTVFYRPLQTLSYMVDFKLAGKANPAMFHFTNAVLLGLISCSLMLLLVRFNISRRRAMFGALLYCINPLFVSSVAWIPARGDLLLTLFALLSLVFLSNYLRTQSPLQLFLHWLMFVAAIFCKETAALLPAVFISYYLLVFGHKTARTRYPLFVVSYVLTGLLWYGLRSKAIFTLQGEHAVIGAKAVLANIRMFPEALASFFLPVNIVPIPYFSNTKTVAGMVIILLIAALFVFDRLQDRRTGLFCLCWFSLLLLPSLLFKHHLIDYLNHRFLLPLIGIIILLVVNIPEKWGEGSWRFNKYLPLFLILPLSAGTFIQARAYKDAMTFCNAALAGNQNSALMYNQRSALKRLGNDLQGAITDCRRAIQIYPEYEEAYNSCGIARSQAGDYQGSVSDFNVAISLNSSYPDPYYLRGLAYYNLQDYNRALADFSSYRAVAKAVMAPVDFNVYNEIGKTLAQLERFTEAVSFFDQAVAGNPNYAQSYVNRAITRLFLKDYAGVIADCDRALALKDDANARQLRARAVAALPSASSVTH